MEQVLNASNYKTCLHYCTSSFRTFNMNQDIIRMKLSSMIIHHPIEYLHSIHPSGPYSVQSVGAAKVVSLAIGHNSGQVTTPTQDTSMLALFLPTSEGWQAESTPPGVYSTAKWDLNLRIQGSQAHSKNPKPTTLTIKPTPGIIFNTNRDIMRINLPPLLYTILWNI